MANDYFSAKIVRYVRSLMISIAYLCCCWVYAKWPILITTIYKPYHIKWPFVILYLPITQWICDRTLELKAYTSANIYRAYQYARERSPMLQKKRVLQGSFKSSWGLGWIFKFLWKNIWTSPTLRRFFHCHLTRCCESLWVLPGSLLAQALLIFTKLLSISFC